MASGTGSRWGVGVIAAVTCLHAAYLLTIGVAVSVSSGGAATSQRETMWSALIPLAGGLFALLGAVRAKKSFIVGGSLTVLIFGVLFIFSAGLYFALLGVALAISAAIASRALPEERETAASETTQTEESAH